MSVYGDEDVCRVCRSGVETGPLHRPCKCSGSIRYVHQDCLVEWLGHSRKQYCELCHHPFAFTKIYRPGVPESLPPLLVIRKAFISIFWSSVFVLRAILVAFTWIGILPYATVWVWRLYWFIGNSLSSTISNLLLSRWTWSTSSSPLNDTIPIDSSPSPSSLPLTSDFPSRTNLTEFEIYRDSLRAMGRDTFTGQIITCCVMIAFVCAFLLREWAHQLVPADFDEPVLMDGPARPALAQARPFPRNHNHNHEQDQHDEPEIQNLPANERGEILEEIEEIQEIQEIQEGESLEEGEIREGESLEEGEIREERITSEIQPTSSTSVASPSLSTTTPPLSPEIHPRSDNNERLSVDHTDSNTNEIPIDKGKQADTLHDNAESQEPTTTITTPTTTTPKLQLLQENVTSASSSATSSTPSPLASSSSSSSSTKEPNLDANIFDPPPFDTIFGPVDNADIVNESEDDDDDDAESDREDEEEEGEDAADGGRAEEEERIDDIESIMEAIGMKGSLLTLLQSVALVVLMVSLILSASVLAPFVIGRILTSAGLSSLLLAPLIVAWRIVLHLYRFSNKHIGYLVLPITNRLLSAETLANYLSKAASSLVSLSNERFPTPKLAMLSTGRSVFTFLSNLSKTDSNTNRFVCIILGYVIIAFAAASYVSAWGNRYSERVGQAVRDSVHQQLMLFKVAVFLVIELAVFPLGCGILLDFCTLPVFPGASVASRLEYHMRAPFSAAFLTWLVGTAFMFVFASLVSMARQGLRPGVLWFIKDPQDPQYQPIADLHRTSAGAQLQKILRSAVLYSIIVALCFGVPSHLGRNLFPSVLPLRWDLSQPLSPFPIDLLVYLFVVPPTIRAVRPRRLLRRGFIKWAKLTARQLRLTSFLFGQRRPIEEGRFVDNSRWSWLPARDMMPLSFLRVMSFNSPNNDKSEKEKETEKEIRWERDGVFMRVPAIDSVKLVAGRALYVRVDEAGIPLTAEGARDVLRQEIDAGLRNDHFTTVYLPPHHRFRLIAFLYLCWFSGTLTACFSFLVPLLVGRLSLDWVLERQVHDTYALGVGAFVCLAFAWIAERLYRLRNWLNVLMNNNQNTSDKQGRGETSSDDAENSRQRRRRELILNEVKQKSIDCLHWLRLAIVVGGILPLTISACVDGFIVFPLSRESSDNTGAKKIWLLQEWAYGLILLSIGFRVLRMNFTRAFWISERLEQINDARQRSPLEGAKESSKLAEAIIWRLIALTMAPAFIAWVINEGASRIIARQDVLLQNYITVPKAVSSSLSSLFSFVFSSSTSSLSEIGIPPTRSIAKALYAACTSAFVYSFIGQWVCERVKTWLNQVRDDEFLVERRLRNVDEPIVN